MEQKIEYIKVENIFPHPKNPRKELGNLQELTESIKANGIFQNLTVVPFNEKYTVIIGHRRLAAAKLAGLESVPCIVMDMDEKRQLSTMLLENIQRSDLTIYEQAQGFQMMFDLEGAVLERLFDIGEDSDWQSILRAEYEENPVKTFGCFAYTVLEMPNERYYNNNLEVQKCEKLDAVYDFLQKLGYELSDEELSLKNGTHVLLKRG